VLSKRAPEDVHVCVVDKTAPHAAVTILLACANVALPEAQTLTAEVPGGTENSNIVVKITEAGGFLEAEDVKDGLTLSETEKETDADFVLVPVIDNDATTEFVTDTDKEFVAVTEGDVVTEEVTVGETEFALVKVTVPETDDDAELVTDEVTVLELEKVGEKVIEVDTDSDPVTDPVMDCVTVNEDVVVGVTGNDLETEFVIVGLTDIEPVMDGVAVDKLVTDGVPLTETLTLTEADHALQPPEHAGQLSVGT
jgi:exosome complex RNA-binding protein Csl4